MNVMDTSSELLHDQVLRDCRAISTRRSESTAAQLDAIWGAALQRSGDPLLSVHLGQVFRPTMSVYTSSILWSPTVGAALRNLARFWSPHSSASGYSTVTIAPAGDGLRLVYGMENGHLCNPFDAEFRMLRVLTLLRRISDPSLVPLRLQFQHGSPIHAVALARAVGAPIAYNQPETAMEFEAATLEKPVLATAEQRTAILSLCKQALAAQHSTGNLAVLVRETIRLQLESGSVSIREVAPRLGMSPRTLQRQLHQLQTGFQELLDETRKDACLTIMSSQSVSNARIAAQLGYSNVANFHRAFRRWFGATPNQVRRNLPAVRAQLHGLPPAGSMELAARSHPVAAANPN